MKKNGIAFEELRELLCELGFEETLQKTPTKTVMRFAHPRVGTILLFRVYRPKEAVSDRDMLVVRGQLLDNGLIDPAAFDHFLHKATA